MTAQTVLCGLGGAPLTPSPSSTPGLQFTAICLSSGIQLLFEVQPRGAWKKLDFVLGIGFVGLFPISGKFHAVGGLSPGYKTSSGNKDGT